jgi:hypothetical protein
VSDELVRRPEVSFTGQGAAFVPPERTARSTPRDADHLPDEGMFLILHDAWGHEVFVPLHEYEAQFGITYSATAMKLLVQGVVSTRHEVTSRMNYGPGREGHVELRDDHGPSSWHGPMFGYPYLP